MAESCSNVAILVVIVVSVLLTLVLGPICAQVLAAMHPMMGMVMPFACLLCTGGCLCCSQFARPPKRDEDYEDGPDRPSQLGNPVAEAVGAPAPRWQVKAGAGGTWIDFDVDVSFEIDDAQARGEETFQVAVRGQTYEINLAEMTQKNLATGRKRSIRHTGHAF